MSLILNYTLLEPLVTGAILGALTYGPADVRTKFLGLVAATPYVTITPAQVILGLQVLFALGIVRRISGFLDWLSFRNWELFYSGRPWVWNEEIAVVTGGSGGIATALIVNLIKKGVRVAIFDVQEPPAATKNHKLVKFYKCDLTSSKAIHEAAEGVRRDFGKPTILVNNAGLANGATIVSISDVQLDRIFKVNLISQWYTVREFLPDMIKGKKGHVLTVASMASYTGVAGIADYCATKAGALAFHEALTQEIRHVHNAPYIRTTCAHPFWTTTAMTADIESGIKKTDNLMTPEEVGGVLSRGIFSTNGGHYLIPENTPKMKGATLVRGLPSWINSRANDTTKENVLTGMKELKRI